MDTQNTNVNIDIENNQGKNENNKHKRGLFVKIYAVTITIAVLALGGILIYNTFIKEDETKTVEAGAQVSDETMYTAKQVAELIDAEKDAIYDKAFDEGKEDLLDTIYQRMSTGTTTLELLRELFPEKLVYSEVGGYVFGDILDLPKSGFGKTDFVLNDAGILEYKGTKEIKTYKAIDVSKFQGDIDWKQVKEDGVEYVFIRVGVRGYGTGKIVEDEKFEQNIKGALAEDLKVGVYFFSEAINEEEALEEAEFVLDKIKDYNITLPVVMDIEEIPNEEARNEALTKEELTQVCLTFMEKIESEGYSPMLYGNIKCLVSMVDIEKLSDYDIWYAYYNDEIYIPYEVAGWQYASDGKVAGVDTDCDLNIFFKEWD